MKEELELLNGKYKTMKKDHHAMLKTLVLHQSKMHQYENELKLSRTKNIISQETLKIANEIILSNDTELIEQLFTSEDLKQLEMVPPLRMSDREYTRELLAILYRGEKDKLPNSQLRASKKNEKVEITPKKLRAANIMLIRRMDGLTNEDERIERSNPNYIRRIISDSLRMIGQQKH